MLKLVIPRSGNEHSSEAIEIDRDATMAQAAAKHAPSSAIEKKPILEIRRSSRVGEVYWCAFSPHNWPPEFDDQHLVVVIRTGKKENSVHVVVPLTKRPQSNNPHGYKLARNPNPGSAPEAWAVCDHVYTVASERLKLLRDSNGVKKEPARIDSQDLAELSRKVFNVFRPFFAHGYPEAAAKTQKGEVPGNSDGAEPPEDH